PEVPVVLALTGTDVYHPLRESARGMATARQADRLVVLQPLALQELPVELHPRTRVIYQSVGPPLPPHRPPENEFRICVLGHLRDLKDPFRAAAAARLVPEQSRLRVYHAGGVLEPPLLERARQENRANQRYRWLGELPAEQARQLLASSHLLVHSSLKEGGANVVSEAIALGVPVLASHIPGNVGLLGQDYPGYFPPQDTGALADLILRAETDHSFYHTLKKGVLAQQPNFLPDKELQAWKNLLQSLGLAIPR
ncbi:MAG: glycosyltransferase, partial [Calditrichaeota bacterium]